MVTVMNSWLTDRTSRLSSHSSGGQAGMQNNPIYANVDHFNHETDQKIKVKQDEETVTSSSFRAKIKREADIDPCGLYSYITEPQ